MRTENTILIRGDPDRIYQLAANIKEWPTLLPHYRYVLVEEQVPTIHPSYRIAWMGASRDGFPVRWRCRQELLPDERRILFQHIGGITKGMDVEWRIVAEGDAIRVTISHELNYPNLPAGDVVGDVAVGLLGWFAEHIVGRIFVHNIAGKTLQCIKQIVETEAKTAAS